MRITEGVYWPILSYTCSCNFVFDQGAAIGLFLHQERFVYSPPFAKSNIVLLFGTPIDLERRDRLSIDPKETNI